MKRLTTALCTLALTAFAGPSPAVAQTASPASSPAAAARSFTLGEREFLLDGKPYLIRAGEIHFPRIPREYWEHRIQMCKAMGMNTICIYLFWNYHEAKPDVFDFSGSRDVAEFVRLIQKHGMYAIVRPGPYCCAEWDMGGLPWWLLKKQDLQVRTLKDPYFMERAGKYLGEVGKQLSPLLIQNGGPILMVQVENEYATFGGDGKYMAAIRDTLSASGFGKAQLFRCDWSSNFNRYTVDDVAVTLNFGAGSNIDAMFKEFIKLDPKAPRMCSEYWTGWFDHWGRRHETRDVKSFIGSFKDMLDRRISVSLYMAHGGTSFGQWGGANAPAYSAMVSSYDYNAPIDEAGHATEKFHAVRDLLKNYLNPGETIPEPPAAIPMIAIPQFRLTEAAPMFDNLPPARRSADVKPMEEFDLGWGRILYRTTIPAATPAGKLEVRDACDWALVYVNGARVGNLDRRRKETTVNLPALKAGDRLDILVDAMGRVNFGAAIIDRKGITTSVSLLTRAGATPLKNWEVFPIDVDYPMHQKLRYTAAAPNGPAWYRGTFTLDKLGDTHLDLASWGRGMVWVNGHNLGRYWNLGPQQTMYLPGCWLRQGVNEVVVLDLESPNSPVLAGVTTPVLDVLNPDASLLNRKPGQTLRLAGETPVATGRMEDGAGWQTVRFAAPVTGRHLAIEAVSALNARDTAASLAEIELLGPDGAALPVDLWSVTYADSEEILQGNHTADKVFDHQESTFWHTDWSGKTPRPHPHAFTLDLGESRTVTGVRFLARGDKNTNGVIRDFRIFLKPTPFAY